MAEPNKTVIVDYQSDQINFKCEICGRFYSTYEGLTYHKNTTHQNGPFECQKCGKTFKTFGILDMHIRKVHKKGEKNSKLEQFQCENCQKVYKNKASLNFHNRKHHKNSQTCFLCDKNFDSMVDLKLHLKSVHIDRNSKVSEKSNISASKVGSCSMCNLKFDNLTNTKIHEKSFQNCPTCGKKFCGPKLRSHRVICGEKPKLSSCVNCSKTFNFESHMKIHQKSCEIRYQSCRFCTEMVASNSVHNCQNKV